MSKRIFFILLVLLLPAAQAQDSDGSSGSEPATKTLVWPDGTRYVGGVVDGKRSGKGTIFWQDGTRFVGQFEDDMRNGPGTMILPDGTVYTGFFRNDELVDTQSTLAASNASELDDDSAMEALDDTQLPMEADSLGDEGVTDVMPDTVPDVALQVDDMPETAIMDSDPEPEQLAPNDTGQDETTQNASSQEEDSSMLASSDDYSVVDPYADDVTEITASVESELQETVRLWAAAWSEQNVPQYLSNYSDDFAVPGKLTRSAWEAQRRTRLTRPRYINVDIDFQGFEYIEPNVVEVAFRQAYRSNSYRDLTEKVLRMRKEGTDWKILVEQSR